jgi:hypothetical protein
MADASTKIAYSSAAITHVGSGAQMAANTLFPAAASDFSTALSSTNLGRYPRADIALMFTHTASMAPASNTLNLYRRDINFDGTNDDPLLTTVAANLYKHKYVGMFVATPYSAASTTYTQTMMIPDVPLTDQCEFYVENVTNATILAGWTLKVTPKTDVGATA